MNDVLCGDCLDVLNGQAPNSVDLVYLDPPFFTQKEQRLKSRDGAVEYAFNDTWDTVSEYRQYIQDRLVKCHRVLRDTGSLFLHCDRSASHHLRIALDEVFGADNFQSEIIWTYRRWSNAKKGLLNAHQVIFFYSKTDAFKFRPMYEAYSPATNVDQILQERVRDARGKAVYRTDADGNCVLAKEKRGVPLSDVWEIPYLNPKAKERVGYPTQKPILLLEKIIALTTDPGDLVLDPFCGSGTTLVAAKLLGRKYLGIDQKREATLLSERRLANPIRTDSELLRKGVGAYRNQDEATLKILEQVGAVVVQRNKGIDGFVRTQHGLIPLKVKKPFEAFEEAKNRLLKASLKNNYPQQMLLVLDALEEEVCDAPPSMLIFNNVHQLTKALGVL